MGWVIRFFVVLFFALAVCGSDLLAQESENSGDASSGFQASEVPGWKFFRGDNFDGISTERGIASSWDEKGPPVLWSIDLGQGYSGFVGEGGRVVTQFQSLTGQFVVCLNAQTGEKILSLIHI